MQDKAEMQDEDDTIATCPEDVVLDDKDENKTIYPEDVVLGCHNC